MRIVTTLKHWQIFVIALGIFLTIDSIDLAGRSELVDDILYLAFIGANFGWILVLGSVLFRLKSPRYKTAYLTFMASGLILIGVVAVLKLSATDKEMMELMDQNPMIRWGFVIVTLISFSIINSFPVRLLKIIETGDDVDINDYFGDIFLLIFWPIGIWIIQPRLNRLNLK